MTQLFHPVRTGRAAAGRPPGPATPAADGT